MSYLNHSHDPRRRATAIAVTIAVHGVIGLVVVTGLSFAGYKTVKAFDPILDFPTEPPEPAPPPPEPAVVQPPQAAEPKIVLQPPPPGPIYEEFEPTEVVIVDTPRVLPSPGPTFIPRPQPSFTPKRAVPANDSAGWITNDDYPRRAIIDGAEGAVSYRLVISTAGRVASCELTRPTGNRALDDATCRLISGRARFEPATDETGATVLGTFTGSVRWELPD
jgi:protein TonB